MLNILFLVLYILAIYVVVMAIYNDLSGKIENKLKMPKVFFMAEKGVELPQKSTSGAAGYDFRAYAFKKIYENAGVETDLENSNFSSIALHPGERVLISTGIKMKIPEGYELQIRSRSGLSLKQGLTVLNSPGTIDSDYLGDIGVILHNSGNKAQKIYLGDRICQGVFAKVEEPEFQETVTFKQTKRGSNGYGSTGRN